MTTRRNLVLGGAGTLLGASAVPAAALATAADVPSAGSRQARAPGARLIGTRFDVHSAAGRVLSARLARIERAAPDARVEQFTLSFTAPAAPALSAGIYGVTGAGLGLVPLYLEVSPATGGGQVLQASFGLLREALPPDSKLDALLRAVREQA